MDNLIGDAVDRFILDSEEEREMDGKWHPSSLSSPCVRKAVMEKRKVPFTTLPDDETKRIFMLGKIIHRLVQDAAANDSRIGMVIPEVEIETDDIAGKGDILIFRTDIQAYELVEIKSIKAVGIKYGIPKQEHRYQAGTYAMVLMQNGGHTEDGMIIPPLGSLLKSVRFVYVEKESMTMHERVEDAQALASLAEDRLAMLRRMDETGLLPVVTGRSQWFKNYCPYRGSGLCCGD